MTARRNLEWSAGSAGPVLGALASDQTSDWREFGACAETDPDAFYPEKGESNRAAKKICGGCFVRKECLAYALAADETWGVWGGTSETERRRLKARAAA